MTQPGCVLAEFVRAYWPGFVSGSLEHDLQPVVDAEPIDEDAPCAALADGATSDLSPQVASSIAPGDPECRTARDGC